MSEGSGVTARQKLNGGEILVGVWRNAEGVASEVVGLQELDFWKVFTVWAYFLEVFLLGCYAERGEGLANVGEMSGGLENLG